MRIPTLETARLILRPLTAADAPAIFQWAGDPVVTRFMPYDTYTRVEDVEAWLRSVEQNESDFNFGFVRKSDGLLIGSGDVGPDERTDRWGFGYNLRRDCWNQGYATEAARAMIRFARDVCGATGFIANHAVDNPASGRVMEKCGLHFDHLGQYASFDGQRIFPARFYIGSAEDTLAAETAP